MSYYPLSSTLIPLGQRGRPSPRTRHHLTIEEAPTQLPPRKQHLVRISPLVDDHPLSTNRQQTTPHTIRRNTHPYMGPHHYSFNHHGSLVIVHLRERNKLLATKIDRRQHHIVCNFCPTLILLVMGLLV